jgi:NAD(P)-dependent dehydrogenase (short-subunit alcohol dehydrogenase family)
MSVWMGARDRVRGEEAVRSLQAEGFDVRFIEFDVADDASVRRAAERVTSETGALHVLVNNAGIIIDPTTPPSKIRMEDAKATYEVNLFGPIRVTQAFILLLMAAEEARIIMMSSGVGSLTLITDPTSIYSSVNLLAYTSSKVALNAVTVSFAKELEPLGIKVNTVEPGHVQTDLNANTGVLTPEEGAVTAIKTALIGQDAPQAASLEATGGSLGDAGERARAVAVTVSVIQVHIYMMPAEARELVVVHKPYRLHPGVDDRRVDEVERRFSAPGNTHGQAGLSVATVADEWNN